MNKNIVRLTEPELKNIVESSVRRTIKEGLVTEEMLNENVKDKAVQLAKMAGVSIAVATSWLLALGFGVGGFADDSDDAIRDKNAANIEKALKNTPDTISQGDIATGRFDINNESVVRRAVTESLRRLMRSNG